MERRVCVFDANEQVSCFSGPVFFSGLLSLVSFFSGFLIVSHVTLLPTLSLRLKNINILWCINRKIYYCKHLIWRSEEE
jgi:hypothetical protein